MSKIGVGLCLVWILVGVAGCGGTNEEVGNTAKGPVSQPPSGSDGSTLIKGLPYWFDGGTARMKSEKYTAIASVVSFPQAGSAGTLYRAVSPVSEMSRREQGLTR